MNVIQSGLFSWLEEPLIEIILAEVDVILLELHVVVLFLVMDKFLGAQAAQTVEKSFYKISLAA